MMLLLSNYLPFRELDNMPSRFANDDGADILIRHIEHLRKCFH